MDRDLHNNIPLILEQTTQCTTSQANRRKGRKRQKENYNEKFLIKRVKTRCLKIYLRLILDCINASLEKSKLKVNEKRNVFKLFKSDVCKSRNRAILYQSMKHLLRLFSNIVVDGIPVKRDRLCTFNYLMNLKWEEFILHVKHKANELFEAEASDPVVLLGEIAEFFSYIKNETKYKPRSIDVNYATLYDLLEDGKKDSNTDGEIMLYIENFKEI
jgi:hypothetical protein